MSDLKFDPMTGQPIGQQTTGFKFDPITGQPINQQPVGQQPVGQQPVGQQPIGQQPMGQQPVGQQNFGGQQSYSAQQNGFGTSQANSFGYDPKAIEKEQDEKNKKLAIKVMAGVGVLLMLIIAFGIYKFAGFAIKHIPEKKQGADSRNEVTAEISTDVPVEEPADKVDVPVDEPADEPVDDLQLQKIEEPNPEDFVVDEPTDDVQEEPADDVVAETPDNTVAASNDTRDLFSVRVGSFEYTFPEKVTTFLNDGWTFDDQKTLDESLGSRDYEYCTIYYPGSERGNVTVNVTNFDPNAQVIRDCYITKVTFSDYDIDLFGADISTHNGDIVVGQTTENEIIAALGTPDNLYEEDDGNFLTYYGEAEGYNEPSVLYKMNEEGKLKFVCFENDTTPTDFVQTEVSSEAPDYLSNYVAPTSLGDDPFSGNFKMDGVVYTLPLPFTELINNGWKYGGDLEYTAGAGAQYVVQFEKNDRCLTATAYNPSDMATLLKYTVITEIHAEDSTFNPAVEFPAGLSPSMSETELLAFMTKNNITNYDYLKASGCYTIPFDQTGNDRSAANNRYEIFVQDGYISWMTMQNYGWTR